MLIRNERPDDIRLISQIHYTAFKDHPVHVPGADPTEHLVVEHLRRANELTLSLVAEVERWAVGHIALSPAVVGVDRSGWFLLGPVGVLPHHQGKGIGSALIRDSLHRIRSIGAAGVVLVGDPGFYTKLGFKNVQGLTYSGVPDEYVLAICFGTKLPHGEIVAHEAFEL